MRTRHDRERKTQSLRPPVHADASGLLGGSSFSREIRRAGLKSCCRTGGAAVPFRAGGRTLWLLVGSWRYLGPVRRTTGDLACGTIHCEDSHTEKRSDRSHCGGRRRVMVTPQPGQTVTAPDSTSSIASSHSRSVGASAIDSAEEAPGQRSERMSLSRPPHEPPWPASWGDPRPFRLRNAPATCRPLPPALRPRRRPR